MMENLTYNYGKTPREVIVEQCDKDATCFTIFEQDSDISVSFGSDDLLTVLDALAFVSDHGGTYEQHLRTPAYQLRVDILAALGIEEK